MNVIITLKLPITYITSVLFCILFNSVKGQEDFDIFLNNFVKCLKTFETL